MSILDRSRAVRRSAERATRRRTESRTAMVWAIYQEQRLCEVVFQGAWDQPVIANYPSHWREIPTWLKVEAAVEVRHPQGNQTSLMVVGPGAAVPTPEMGQTTTPVQATGQNCVISGCEVYVLTGMQVWVKTGQYRINDLIYSTGLWTMSADSPVMMAEGSPLILGQVADVIQLSAADASKFRFDLLCIGADQVIDYLVGTPDATNPEKPTLPAAHVELAPILVPPTTTDLGQGNINQSFVAPMASALEVSVQEVTLTWSMASADISVTILDQYNRPLIGNWSISATILQGTGSVTEIAYTRGGASVTITYSRNNPQGEGVESCPVFIEFKLLQDTDIANQTAVLLEDEWGGLILG